MTLAGEGLQHQDGNSHVLALTVPNLVAYDPAYAYELAVIIEDGIRRMMTAGEDVFYYLTVMNESYPQPAMHEGARAGILKGAHRLPSARDGHRPQVRLLGSGAILNEAVHAAEMLAERFDVAAEVWSVTSYKQLQRDAMAACRHNRLQPDAAPQTAWVQDCFDDGPPLVAATDYVQALPAAIAPFVNVPLNTLGTDGYGRSDGREALRDFFEVDRRHIALAALQTLAAQDAGRRKDLAAAVDRLDIDPDQQPDRKSTRLNSSHYS